MRGRRPSLASLPRGAILAAVSAWSVVLHVLDLVLVALTATPVHHAPIVASTAVWAAITAWGWLRGARMSGAEVATAVSCGAVAITADGVWGGSPGHTYVVSTALTALVLAVGALSSGRAALLGNAVVLGCQVALLVAALGSGPLAVYVAVATTATTGTAGLITWWLQSDLFALVASTQDAARRDPLTGLLNRRGMAEHVGRVRASAPAGHHLAAVVLDLDHFKRVNDVHGHGAGDQLLVEVAEVMRARARRQDVLVRLGGEELAWLGAWSSPQDAVAAAEQLRSAIAAVPGPAGLGVTASIGVAFGADAPDTSDVDEALSRLLVRADAALYEAKAAGRDRVVLASRQVSGGGQTSGQSSVPCAAR